MAVHFDLFQRLQNVAELNALVQQTEDLHLDCKVWPPRDDDVRRILAKAICGFANADGGVIVIGFEAKGGPDKYDPDVIKGPVPVADTISVKSRIEALVGDLVEPRVEGVLVATVPEVSGAKAGFVLIDVPPSEGFPCRTRKTHEFYQRITAGTYPMEYFQIADMFGKRHKPVLSLHLVEGPQRRNDQMLEREFTIGIYNVGRAVAKFPSIRFNREHGVNIDPWGIDGNRGFGLPLLPTEPELIVFGGGADHVIYPGTLLKIAKFHQRASGTGWAAVGGDEQICFQRYTLTAEISADEMLSSKESAALPYRVIL